ncbi:MAG: hypothetical protein ABH952_11730 [Candidatus Omnitrophota bacterium]
MAKTAEIKSTDLRPQVFIDTKVKEITELVEGGEAINALSGGVDSAVVTMLGHKALGPKLKTCFMDNGLMRKDEPQQIAEEELNSTGAFQYLAILHQDRVTGMRNGKRDFGQQIEIRCWDSVDARIATPTRLPYETLVNLAKRIVAQVPGVVSVTYNITSKQPSTMEAI